MQLLRWSSFYDFLTILSVILVQGNLNDIVGERKNWQGVMLSDDDDDDDVGSDDGDDDDDGKVKATY